MHSQGVAAKAVAELSGCMEARQLAEKSAEAARVRCDKLTTQLAQVRRSSSPPPYALIHFHYTIRIACQPSCVC